MPWMMRRAWRALRNRGGGASMTGAAIARGLRVLIECEIHGRVNRGDTISPAEVWRRRADSIQKNGEAERRLDVKIEAGDFRERAIEHGAVARFERHHERQRGEADFIFRENRGD